MKFSTYDLYKYLSTSLIFNIKLSDILRFDGKILYNLEANEKTLFSHKLIRDLEILITLPTN
jgi:hypothetical protein